MLPRMTERISTVEQDIHARGDLAAAHELLAMGHTQSSLRSAVGRKEIIRVRKGWYCLPSLAQPFQAAARVGGRLTCVSRATVAGLWIPPGDHGLHVAVTENSCQLRSTADYHQRLSEQTHVIVHWNDNRSSGSRYATDLKSALLRCCGCLDIESVYVLCESALFRRALSASDWISLLKETTNADRAKLSTVGSLSESGTESMFKFRSGAFGVRVRQQVQIGRDRVDFVLGERLVIEIDSVAHHDPTEDAKRDARLSVLGYRVLRFMYTQIVSDWSTVVAAIMAAISRGDHLAG
jgi:very-short-patch-repair endonuclease